MNNLTTRKIVLGLLMALVLAFGVQGIADALTLDKENVSDLTTAHDGMGDLQTITVESGLFEIQFDVTLMLEDTVNSDYREIPDTHAVVQGPDWNLLL